MFARKARISLVVDKPQSNVGASSSRINAIALTPPRNATGRVVLIINVNLIVLHYTRYNYETTYAWRHTDFINDCSFINFPFLLISNKLGNCKTLLTLPRPHIFVYEHVEAQEYQHSKDHAGEWSEIKYFKRNIASCFYCQLYQWILTAVHVWILRESALDYSKNIEYGFDFDKSAFNSVIMRMIIAKLSE